VETHCGFAKPLAIQHKKHKNQPFFLVNGFILIVMNLLALTI